MNAWKLRAATSADLPRLTRLLPAWELERASFIEDEGDSLLLLAFPMQTSATEEPPLACVQLRRRIGLSQPRYWYHVGVVVHAAAELGMFRRERTLLLGNDHTGATELSDFAVDDQLATAAQQRELPSVLVRAALLLLYRDWQLQAEAGSQPPKVIAAVPGRRDASGHSPFWQGLGRHFYPGDVDQAQARFGQLWQTHVAALLPRHPLVVSILHESAQAAIGAMDEAAMPWCDALRRAGLRAGQYLNLFDAGPVFEAPLDLLRCSGAVGSHALDLGPSASQPAPVLLTADSGSEVYIARASIHGDGRVSLSPEQVELFGLHGLRRVWAMSTDDAA
ncbi:MAG: arginine N-succinyltransferase [Lysobacterales bacterium]